MAEQQGAVAVADHDQDVLVDVEDGTATAGAALAAVEGPGPDGAAAADGPGRVEAPGLLIYAQGYTPTQEQVMSSWNTGEPGGLLHAALRELRSAGWLRADADGVPAEVLEQQNAMAAALLIAVSALESAALQTNISLAGADQLLGALLDGEPIPSVDEWNLVADK